MLNNFVIDVKKFYKDWKIISFKPRHSCTLEELIKKETHSKMMCYGFTIAMIICLGIVVELFAKNMVSIMFNTLLIICMIASYDELQNLQNIRLFIYFKKKEILEDIDKYGR